MGHSLNAILAISAASLCFVAPAIGAETVTYNYDAQGRLVGAVHTGTGPNGGLDIEYRYDLAGNRVTQTAKNSKNQGQQVIVVPLKGFSIIPINP